jgi:hypothetical protein
MICDRARAYFTLQVYPRTKYGYMYMSVHSTVAHPGETLKAIIEIRMLYHTKYPVPVPMAKPHFLDFNVWTSMWCMCTVLTTNNPLLLQTSQTSPHTCHFTEDNPTKPAIPTAVVLSTTYPFHHHTTLNPHNSYTNNPHFTTLTTLTTPTLQDTFNVCLATTRHHHLPHNPHIPPSIPTHPPISISCVQTSSKLMARLI